MLKGFKTTTLDTMADIALLKRFDSKFVVPSSWIPFILSGLESECQLLKTCGTLHTLYDNIYFDDPANICLEDHLRGKGHRFKVRLRRYSSTSLVFLEVKERLHNGRTVKHRLQRSGDSFHPDLSASEQDFIAKILPHMRPLIPSLISSFDRITLANFTRGERITIDRDLKFEDTAGRTSSLEGLSIIELKQPRKSRNTPLHDLLRSHPDRRGMLGRSMGVSKYAVARLRCNPTLQTRTYGATLRHLERALICAHSDALAHTDAHA
jgi:hypothetical protein